MTCFGCDSLTIVIILSCIALNISCTFHVASSANILDLTQLQNTTLYGNNTEYRYQYTPCGNSAYCTSNNSIVSSMINQISKHDDTCIALAYWDKGQAQPEYDPLTETFLFKYFNGDLCQNKNENTSIAMQIYWACDINVSNYFIASVGLIENCTYEMYIYSRFACNITSSNTTDVVHFSIGTWIVISFFVLIFLYCIIGACVNAMNDANDKQMPHHQFWMTLPLWVVAGFQVTRDVICCRVQQMEFHKNLAGESHL